MDSRPTYVVDSCYLIDWISGGAQDHANEAKAVHSLIENMEAGRCRLIISALAIAEILPEHKKHTQKSYEQFTLLLRGGSKLFVCPLDVSLAQMVAQLREDLRRVGIKKLADAVHLATAIHTEAESLYTRDDALLALNDRLDDLSMPLPTRFGIRKIPPELPLLE